MMERIYGAHEEHEDRKRNREALVAMFEVGNQNDKTVIEAEIDRVLLQFKTMYDRQQEINDTLKRRAKGKAIKALKQLKIILRSLTVNEQFFYDLSKDMRDRLGSSFLPREQMLECLDNYEKIFTDVAKYEGKRAPGRKSDMPLSLLISDLIAVHQRFMGRIPGVPSSYEVATTAGLQYGPFTRMVAVALEAAGASYPVETIHNAARKGASSAKMHSK